MAAVPPTYGLWLTQGQVNALPITGSAATAWSQVTSAANGSWGSPTLYTQTSKADVYCLAGALYYAKTGDGQLGL
jgi:hypothetical protein